MLASDAMNTEFAGAYNPDARLSVTFYNRPVQNHFKTTKEGRPIFEDMTFVKIFVPGDSTTVIDTVADDSHKARFPMQWAHFTNTHGADGLTIGTPITQWPAISAAQAEELKALKFSTVEQVASASDAQIQKIGMLAGMSPHAFRDRARAFLLAAKDSALPQAQAEELRKKDEQIAALQAQMAELAKTVEGLKPPKQETLTVKKG